MAGQLRGRDILEIMTAHELAALLLAGPDLVVRVPNEYEPSVGEEDHFRSLSMYAYNEQAVFLSGDCLDPDTENVSGDYEWYVDDGIPPWTPPAFQPEGESR